VVLAEYNLLEQVHIDRLVQPYTSFYPHPFLLPKTATLAHQYNARRTYASKLQLVVLIERPSRIKLKQFMASVLPLKQIPF